MPVPDWIVFRWMRAPDNAYHWATQEWAGTCREVVLTRDDGRHHRAAFPFR